MPEVALYVERTKLQSIHLYTTSKTEINTISSTYCATYELMVHDITLSIVSRVVVSHRVESNHVVAIASTKPESQAFHHVGSQRIGCSHCGLTRRIVVHRAEIVAIISSCRPVSLSVKWLRWVDT